jgi:hypothetical protein
MAKDILSAIGNMNEEGVLADILKKKSANSSLYFLKLPKKFRRDWILRIVFLQGIFSSAPSSNRVETAGWPGRR